MTARGATAIVGGVVFLLAWVSAAMVISDRLIGTGTALQLAYFTFSGLAWVGPIAWLMLWAARPGRG